MTISTTTYNSCDVVKMSGRIDSATSPDLSEAFKGIMNQNRFKLVFDMGEVEFVSSAGIWVLMETQKECKKHSGGELLLANVNDKIQQSLDLAGLKHFFTMFDEVVAAVGHF